MANDLAHPNFHSSASILVYEQRPVVGNTTEQYLLDIIVRSLYDA